jgi:hypothetical protein
MKLRLSVSALTVTLGTAAMIGLAAGQAGATPEHTGLTAGTAGRTNVPAIGAALRCPRHQKPHGPARHPRPHPEAINPAPLGPGHQHSMPHNTAPQRPAQLSPCAAASNADRALAQAPGRTPSYGHLGGALGQGTLGYETAGKLGDTVASVPRDRQLRSLTGELPAGKQAGALLDHATSGGVVPGQGRAPASNHRMAPAPKPAPKARQRTPEVLGGKWLGTVSRGMTNAADKVFGGFLR